MNNTESMSCPHCGAAMNHHADKIDYGVEEAGDAVFGGALQQVYTCPKCGGIELRQAPN